MGIAPSWKGDGDCRPVHLDPSTSLFLERLDTSLVPASDTDPNATTNGAALDSTDRAAAPTHAEKAHPREPRQRRPALRSPSHERTPLR